jgi:5-methylcytosine-specific restriction endonuclease McrA
LEYPVGDNITRSANGNTTVAYWQNKADYKIDVRLDEVKKEISGTVILNYKNNSPHNLSFLWFQMDQNLFNKTSRGQMRMPANSRSRYGDSKSNFDGGYKIKSVEIITNVGNVQNASKADYVIDDTRMQVRLSNPLKAKTDQISIKISYSYSIPTYGADRFGILPSKNGDIFCIAQWYPRICVFDDIKGWNTEPYLGASEFYLEYGDFDFSITAPSSHVVVAGGELQNPKDVYSAEQIQRLEKAKSSFIFATHLHEIVHYDEIKSLSNVALKHMSVVYDKEKDVLVYDRKLKDGPGNNMYGLEVCKSLNLPTDFIEAAYEIRRKYKDNNLDSILSLSSSHFNSQKILGLCEKCGTTLGTEVHHLRHQKEADEKGFISSEDGIFHKNKLANLLTLCSSCHDEFHKSKKQHKKVKTTKGYILKEVNSLK